MTGLSALTLYWSLVLLVVIELRRERADVPGRSSRARERWLYAGLAVAVLVTIVLTVARLHSGG